MNAKRIFFTALLSSGLGASAYGQINCPTATTTPVRAPLVCVLPFTSTDLNVSAGIQASTIQSKLVTPFNAAFATQLTQLPVPTGTVGTILLKDKNDPYGHAFDNLGPILTDRPETIGKGHLYAGFSYQSFEFDKINNLNLNAFPIGFTYTQVSPNNANDFQAVYDAYTDKITFHLDQYVAIVTLGATQTTDISVIIPFNSVSITSLAVGSPISGSTSESNFGYIYNSDPNNWAAQDIPNPVRTPGSASGIGDVTLNVKQMLYGTPREGTPGSFSVGAAFRLPSGNVLNYLGSGAYGTNLYGIFSYRSARYHVAPHIKIGYQWNGGTVLVNPSGQTSNNLPGGMQYDVGADIAIRRTLTFAADVFGAQYQNTPVYSPETLTLAQTGVVDQPHPAAPPVAALPGVSVDNGTYTTANLSTGFKWQVPRFHLLLIGNVTVPINNKGLHSNPVPLFGVAYNFNLFHR